MTTEPDLAHFERLPRWSLRASACGATTPGAAGSRRCCVDAAYLARLFGAFQRPHGQQEFPGTGIVFGSGLAT